jgi:hypothetical protein
MGLAWLAGILATTCSLDSLPPLTIWSARLLSISHEHWVYPARRISIIGACSMFLTALFA